MTRTQITVFVLVAIVALVLGLTVNRVLTAKSQGDPAALLDAGIVLLPQSRSLPALSLIDQDGQAVAVAPDTSATATTAAAATSSRCRRTSSDARYNRVPRRASTCCPSRYRWTSSASCSAVA